MELNQVLDNTLPQSAFAYFKDSGHIELERDSKFHFQVFVDAFVNSRHLFVPIPGEEQGIRDPFMALWQDKSKIIENAGITNLPLSISEEALFVRFLESIENDLNEWAGWICFQSSPTVAPQLRSRVPDWKDQFESALHLIQQSASQMNPNPSTAILTLEQKLEVLFKNYMIDHEYKKAALKRKVPISRYAIANAFNWFRRGSLYGTRFPGMAVMFHSLRDGAVVQPGNNIGEIQQGNLEISWGRILDGFISEGDLARDEVLMRETLIALRESVQFGKTYDDAVQALANRQPSQNYESLLKDVILGPLLDAGLPPVFRQYTFQNRLLHVIRKAAQQHADKQSSLLKRLLFEQIGLVLNSTVFREADIRLRKTLGRDRIWKLYRIPGQD